MPVTIDAIDTMLSQMKLDHLRIDDTHILCGGKFGDILLKLVINVSSGGDYMNVCAVDIATFEASASGFDTAMRVINDANLKYNLIALSWDPDDAEISAGISFPCEDRPVSESQLVLAMTALGGVCEYVTPLFERARREDSPRPARRVEHVRHDRSNTGSRMLSLGVLLLGIAAVLYTVVTLWK